MEFRLDKAEGPALPSSSRDCGGAMACTRARQCCVPFSIGFQELSHQVSKNNSLKSKWAACTHKVSAILIGSQG